MLDLKDRKILGFLLKIKYWPNVKYIADKIGLTMQNLHYHIDHINKLLEKNKLSSICLKNKEINNFEKIKNFYENYIKENNIIFLDKHERENIIIILLLFNKKINLKYLSKILGVTTNSIFCDINNIKIKLNKLNIDINLSINKKGYSIVGNSINVHKLLIKTILDLLKLDTSNSILYFLIKNLNYDDYDFILKNKINNFLFYKYVEEEVSKVYFKFTFVDYDKKTISLILYFLFIKKFNFTLSKKEEKIYLDKKNNFKDLIWYKVSSKLIDNIKCNYNLSNIDIGHFEKTYIAQLFCSYHQKDIRKNSHIFKNNNLIVKNLIFFFKQRNYKLNNYLSYKLLNNFFIFISIIPYLSVFDFCISNNNLNLIAYKKNIEKYLKDFDKWISINKFIKIEKNKNIYWNLLIIFLNYIDFIPNELLNKNVCEIVVVTNLNTFNLNNYISLILKDNRFVKNIEVINYENYIKNLNIYKDRLIITNIKSLNKKNIIFIPYEEKL